MRPLVLVGLACLTLGCRPEIEDEPPERVVQEFVERMQSVHGNPERAREAYELLWSEAKANLAERAHRASAVAGRQVAPEEMIAESRFSLRFKPKRYEAETHAEWAVVTVTGEAPTTQRAQVDCVLEDGEWLVQLRLPRIKRHVRDQTLEDG